MTDMKWSDALLGSNNGEFWCGVDMAVPGSDKTAINFTVMPGSVVKLTTHNRRAWALCDYPSPPWYAFWRKRGLHWVEVNLA
jgi:hypothetical protein